MSNRPVVLIAERLAPSVLEVFGDEFDVRHVDGTDRAALLAALADAAALLVRSSTRVDAEALAHAPRLTVVARAGVGLDNVDVPAATGRGVMVVNAPTSNIVSAAEHAVALLLAVARRIPAADASLRSGEWRRSAFSGVELAGKTVGVVGLGKIGQLVAQRIAAFGTDVIAYDPYVSPTRAAQLGIELVDLDELLARADAVSIHLPKTAETLGLIGADQLAKTKPGVIIVNAARGGLVDESALADAVREGQVGGAGIDVFATEPCTSSPLFGLEHVVVTPHLGASTREAQDKAGDTIAEQVLLALSGGFVPYAVNVSATEASETVRPFLPLAERLGGLFASLNDGVPSTLEVEYQGHLADYDTRILTLAVLKGLLGAGSEEPVSYVNAPQLATERGVAVRESKTSEAKDYVNLISLRGGDHSLAGTLFGLRNEARLVMVDDHTVDIPPSSHMVVVRNDDRPGMIGLVGMTFGRAGVNISDMDVGVSPSGEAALMVISTDAPLAAEVLADLRGQPGILEVHAVSSG